MRAALVVVLALGACDRLYSAGKPGPGPIGDDDAATGAGDGSGSDTPHCSAMSMLDPELMTPQAVFTQWWTGQINQPNLFTRGPHAISIVSTGGAIDATVAATVALDLRDDAFSLSVEGGVFPSNAVLSLALTDASGTNALTISRRGAAMVFAYVENSTEHVVASHVYGAGDRYWRIASGGGTTTWETSSDGMMYTAAMGIPDPTWLGVMQPTVHLTTGPAAAFTVTLGHINGESPHGQACPIAQLADDFAGPWLSAAWLPSLDPTTGGAAVSIESSALLAEVPGGLAHATIRSRTVYDLRGGDLWVDEVAHVSGSDSYGRLTVRTMANDRIDMQQSTMEISAREHGLALVRGVGPNSAGYSWRIRERGGTVYWETHAAGEDWSSFATADDVLGLDRVVVEIGIAQDAAITGDSASFDNVNLP